MKTNLFLKMIQHLREKQEVMLYGNLLRVPETDLAQTLLFLSHEYKNESRDYPYNAPAFDEQAALWAAKTVYTAAQLMLYRENKSDELDQLLPACQRNIDAGAILSADICLRFLPPMLVQLKMIDAEDRLIAILEKQLHLWHYSGVNYSLNPNQLSFEVIASNPCLNQLYANRVIKHKKIKLAEVPELKNIIAGSLGMHAPQFWRDIKIEVYEQ